MKAFATPDVFGPGPDHYNSAYDTSFGGYFRSARSGHTNIKCVGVYGYGEGSSNGVGVGVGVLAEAGGSTSAALYACGGVWAGYFAGNIYHTGSISGPSDARFKTDATPIQNALDKVLRLKPRTYYYDTATYKAMNFPTTRQFGLLAQDLDTIFPELVSNGRIFLSSDSITVGEGKNRKRIPNPDKSANAISPDSTCKAVDYISLIPVLIAAIQEQQKEIATLKTALADRGVLFPDEK